MVAGCISPGVEIVKGKCEGSNWSSIFSAVPQRKTEGLFQLIPGKILDMDNTVFKNIRGVVKMP
jgi:hypothetical protein